MILRPPASRQLLGLALLTLAAAAASACGKKSAAAAAGVGAPTVLEGNWVTACHSDSAGKTYLVLHAVYAGATFNATAATFADKDCTTASGDILGIGGTFALGAASAAVAGATELVLTESQLLLTPTDDASVKVLNTTADCGATDWATGVAKDVTSCKQPKGPSLFYDLVKIDGAAYTNGLTTSDLDGSTPAKRPATLDPSRVFVKK